MRLRPLPLLVLTLLTLAASAARAADRAPAPAEASANPPIHIAFLWHMHQPIYWPYESVVATDAAGRYSYSVTDIHNQRIGPYTSWPSDAVWKGINAGMPHFGAQVSFSGSLIENLDALQAAGSGNFAGWKSPWLGIRSQTTSLGNPRLDLVGFGYHHPLMGLLDSLDLVRQVQAHRTRLLNAFGGAYSKGIFPPENAFTPRMIPALKAEGLDWVLVDNVHFDRAASGYPYSTGGNLVEPNRADVRNANPSDWTALTGLWAPTQVSGGWGHRPHLAQYRDPATGVETRMIVVPADRYMGNEDGRGGFGALQYDAVMSQLQAYNTDPAHPLLVVLHHDGDNYGGGTDSYYHSNFQAFVDWLAANPSRFVCTTVEDYLEQYPPDTSDVIHVEPGSWSGADNGDPEFKKWLGDPDGTGYSPDRNSWAVITAARNIVQTADRIAPAAAGTQTAWHFLLNGEASDYWYWDGSQGGVWDSHPTRAANQAVAAALPVIAGGSDLTGPTVFVPQREPYNPGGTEWTIAQPSTFEVWTYAYDVSGLASVTLRYRLDDDGVLPVSSSANDTYAGGSGVGAWIDVPCAVSDLASTTDPLPSRRAKRYAASVSDLSEKLVDYHVQAVDSLGNVTRSPIQHVWVGTGSGGTTTGVTVAPTNPTIHETITVTVHGAGKAGSLHWGVNNWAGPIGAYWPPGTALWSGGPVVETPMTLAGGDLTLTLGPFDNASQVVNQLDFVLHYADGTWDNHGGADWHVTLSGNATVTPWVMDGAYDSGSTLVASNAGVELRLGWNGSELYVATQAAPGAGKDVFVLVAGARGALTAAPWAKAGQVGAWSAFLANESTNNYSAWTDASGATAKSAGTVLEGTLNLAGELGSVPASVFVAVARYATTDGGTLQGQAPAGDGNGNLEGIEYLEYPLASAGVETVRPTALRLAAPAPNPFGDATRLSFALPREAEVTLEVLDVHGRRVARPASGRFAPGEHAVRWDATALPDGVYFLALRADEQRIVRRVVHLR